MELTEPRKIARKWKASESAENMAILAPWPSGWVLLFKVSTDRRNRVSIPTGLPSDIYLFQDSETLKFRRAPEAILDRRSMRHILTAGLFAIASLAGLSSFHEAKAASFDCAQATNVRERLICSNTKLSALDDELGREYRAHHDDLSAQGAKLLQLSQRSWVKYVGIACLSKAKPFPPGLDDPTECLEGKYQERLLQFKEVGKRFGPFVFNRIDLFDAKVVPGDANTEPGREPDPPFISSHHVAYPQIDSPSSPQADHWNHMMTKSIRPEDDNCRGEAADDQVDYKISYVTVKFISVKASDSWYCYGAAHMWDYGSKNSVLLPDPRPLRASDVFNQTATWQKNLQERFIAALMSEAKDRAQFLILDQIRKISVQPNRWVFTSSGLEISFGAWEVGTCYICGPWEISVPWDQLKPLLSQNAVVP